MEKRGKFKDAGLQKKRTLALLQCTLENMMSWIIQGKISKPIFKKWTVDEKIDFWFIMSKVILKVSMDKLNIIIRNHLSVRLAQ